MELENIYSPTNIITANTFTLAPIENNNAVCDVKGLNLTFTVNQGGLKFSESGRVRSWCMKENRLKEEDRLGLLPSSAGCLFLLLLGLKGCSLLKKVIRICRSIHEILVANY
jgi:hypothetical protein